MWLLKYSPLFYFTQSIWRDEAFSILAAQRPLVEIVPKLTFEPPFYYILLHFWIQIFGTSEVATRSLSFLGVGLATGVVIIWAEKLYKTHWLSWFVPLLFFLNPMIIYYAFEVRTYGWYIFFATVSLYAYSQKRWNLYVIATILGFYTHSYMIFVPLVQGIHWGVSRYKHIRQPRLFSDPMIRSLLFIGIAISPWLVWILRAASKLHSSWYFPVDLRLVLSVLGNMFVGYEGTPGGLWIGTTILSGIFLSLFIFAWKERKDRPVQLLFWLTIFVPLAIVIGVSFVKPIFVNRYLLPVTIAEILLLGEAIHAIQKKFFSKIFATGLFFFITVVNIWYPSHHPKLDIRKTIHEVNLLASPNDIILVDSPLVFFETLYYGRNPHRVFLYNPHQHPFPWYVGDAIVTPSQMVSDIPVYPKRAYVLHENGTFELMFQTVQKF